MDSMKPDGDGLTAEEGRDVNEPVARIKLIAGAEEAEFRGRDAEMFGLLWRDIEQARAIGVGKVVLHLGGDQVKLEFRISRPGLERP